MYDSHQFAASKSDVSYAVINHVDTTCCSINQSINF